MQILDLLDRYLLWCCKSICHYSIQIGPGYIMSYIDFSLVYFNFFRAAFVWELDDSEILLDPTGRLLMTASSNKVHLSSNKDHIFSEYWGKFFCSDSYDIGDKANLM